jgi:DNA-binding transcriptional MocR family regulator
MNVYEELAEQLEERIRKGVVLSGQKLPSVREFSKKENVSPSTVVEAYELLRSRGLIESRDRSGFFVASIRSSKIDAPEKRAVLIPTTKVSADEMVRALRSAVYDQKIFPFGVAAPLPDFFPTKALNRTIQKVLSEDPTLLSEYRFPPGGFVLRDQISQRYRKVGLKHPIESIVTTAGAIEAVGLALKAVAKPGDLIAVESPCYFGILQLVRSLGYNILEVHADPEVGITPKLFEEAVKKASGRLKALVTVSNFSNPLGSRVPDEAKQEIVALAAKSNVVIIEDDIYSELYFEGKRPKPYQAFDARDTVILCGSFSKTVSSSLRVGYAISKKYAPEITFLKTASSSAVSALGEEVLSSYLDSDSYDRHLKDLRCEYKTLVARYSSAVLAAFPAGTKVSEPKGGFVIWVQLPKQIDTRDVQRIALQQSISIAPGPIFSPCNDGHENFMRLNCAIPWTAQSQKAIQKLAKILHEQL